MTESVRLRACAGVHPADPVEGELALPGPDRRGQQLLPLVSRHKAAGILCQPGRQKFRRKLQQLAQGLVDPQGL